MPKTKTRQSAASAESAEIAMYTDIYDAVMEHRLPPRSKLTEQLLCEIYGLARHNVRKVLSQLAHDGMVDLEPNRGAFISSPSPKEAAEMFAIRQALERLVIQSLISNTGTNRLDELKDMVHREREAWKNGDRPTWIRLSADFHVELARLTGNQLLADTLRRLVSRTTLLIASVEAPGQSPCSFDDHEDIISRLSAGDKTGALKSMARHLQGCAHRLTLEEERFDLRTALTRN